MRIRVDQVSKRMGRDSITILNNISFEIPSGSWVSLSGPSGSGKSTLLTLLAGLDIPSEGKIFFDDTELSSLGEDERAHFRAQHTGFVFQNFRLLPHLTALENVSVPLLIQNRRDDKLAKEALVAVGLGHRLDSKPVQMSGGEQQRVALARAFVCRPKVLFADEPTGNLDSKNGKMVLDLLQKLQSEARATLIVVSHDPAIAALGQVHIKLSDGMQVSG